MQDQVNAPPNAPEAGALEQRQGDRGKAAAAAHCRRRIAVSPLVSIFHVRGGPIPAG